jgi:alpha-galactosidase
LCEYLPWVSDPVSKPWEKYDISLYDWRERERARNAEWIRIQQVLKTRQNPDQFTNAFSEGAIEIIENTLTNGDLLWEAVNIPNSGYIPNLPEESIVEVPALISARGITGVQLGLMPDGIAELLRREITCSELSVDSAVFGDRQLALQCLLLDPMITDIDMAKNILNDYLVTYRELLPQYWE